MTPRHLPALAAVIAVGAFMALGPVEAEAQEMSFFVTSENPGRGGDLGGLAGADAHCQMLAAAAGAGNRTWSAYLSTDTVDARDRIGTGPWQNAAGVEIASSVADLHSADNNLTAETALNENGDSPNYIGGPQPLEHDVLTGTMEDGTASDMTCNNWTDGTANSTAMLGHADRLGRTEGVNSWNQVHASQGCAMENLAPTGGAGLFYCFAGD
jgi:hypothetical protein